MLFKVTVVLFVTFSLAHAASPGWTRTETVETVEYEEEEGDDDGVEVVEIEAPQILPGYKIFQGDMLIPDEDWVTIAAG